MFPEIFMPAVYGEWLIQVSVLNHPEFILMVQVRDLNQQLEFGL